MGFKKTLLYVGGLMLATGGPITLFSASDLVGGHEAELVRQAGSHRRRSRRSSRLPASSTAPGRFLQPGCRRHADRHAADATPMPSLAEVLRFDVTVAWVMQRWPRVSTGLPYLQLQGYRVPLVTGTTVADLAGSLTYYFNAQQQVQRITCAARPATRAPWWPS